MAIATVATGSNAAGSSTSGTVSALDGTGASALIVFFYNTDDTGLDITYDGVSLTKVETITQTGQTVSAWILFEPSTGTSNLVASWTNSSEYALFGATMSGGATSGTVDVDFAAASNSAGSGNTQSVQTTPLQTGSWLISTFRAADGTNACTTNNTELEAQGAFGCRMGEYHTTTATSAITQSGTHTNNGAWAMVAVEYGLLPVGTSYTLTAALGTFALTGIAVNLIRAINMIMSVGSFALTGIAVTFSLGKTLAMSVGSFILTGKDATLTADLAIIWTNITKNAASWSNKVKNSSIWTNKDKS